MRSFDSRVVAAVALMALLCVPARAGAQSAGDLYQKALSQDQAVRRRPGDVPLGELRAVVRAYERVVLRHPRSGYCDNALWQAAGVSLLAYRRFSEAADRRTGERFLRLLRTEYPSSSFVSKIDEQLRQFAAVRAAAPVPTQAAKPVPAGLAPQTPPKPVRPPSAARTGVIRQITRQALPPGMRVTIDLDGEVEYQESRLSEPPRLVVDLKRAQIGPSLNKQALVATDDVIRAIRVGQRPENTIRVVIELASEARHTTIALYDPFRLVIDFERPRRHELVAEEIPLSNPAPTIVPEPAFGPPPPVAAVTTEAPPLLPRTEGVPAMPTALPAPVAPARNADGAFSLARQLGLGVSRVVIDPGHGGHDPGAEAHRQREATLVLDIGLRLEALLLKEAGVEVVMTRRTDVFIPLEERTAIANRVGADLFLSIHANASRNQRATGVETYYLNFASNREAEEVAARENSASGKTMHNLPDIVQAIALNNKLDESKDFASLVQDAMIKRLKPQHKAVRSLGVKQAPFVVLIGARMPSVLAEVSFITNKTDASLLGKPAFRQRIAQALFDATMRYQQALKTTVTVAQRPAPEARRD